MNTHSPRYIGRFAPSPTGPLHLGSMLTALASYLDAKSNKGLWLVRIDDLDPPRAANGACGQILNTLERFQLNWDDEVVYQSQRHSHYQDYLQRCIALKLAYRCTCSRNKIIAAGGIYAGTCLSRPPPRDEKPYAIRIKSPKTPIKFKDQCQGEVKQHIPSTVGDFIIKRKDGLYAYHLACAVDDHLQGITHIVRGRDLMDSTPRQIYLQQVLGFSTPSYLHLPVVVNSKGQKLSKQTHAPNVAQLPVKDTLYHLLFALGLTPPESIKDNIGLMLDWGIDHWRSRDTINKQSIIESSLNF